MAPGLSSGPTQSFLSGEIETLAPKSQMTEYVNDGNQSLKQLGACSAMQIMVGLEFIGTVAILT